MAQFTDVSNLPAAYRIASEHCRRNFITKDRGFVRRANDQTFDSQAQVFIGWCKSLGFTEHDILSLTDAQCVDILGTYVSEVARGSNLKHKNDLSSQSLRNYMRAAHRVLQLWLQRDIPIYDSSSMGKQPRFHEYIGQQLRDRRNWERKKEKKLPLTRAIYEALASYLASKGDSYDVFLAAVYAVYDWLRLGVFTGFRVSEFAQNKVRKGCQFLAIPDNDDVPEDQRGKPVAFIAADFTFWTIDMVLIPHSKLRKWHARGLVYGLQIRWRFDKSANNFVIRTYTVTKQCFF